MLSILPTLITLLTYLSPVNAAAQVCNGRPEYCSRIYSNITQIAAHDSAFVGIWPTQNQHKSVADQLRMGIRFLQSQTHIKNSQLQMCHTSCLEEDAGSVIQFLTTVKTFLDTNPNEVITILLTNGDRANSSVFDTALQKADLKRYIFTPATGSDTLPISAWPTLGEMIAANTRLVFFLGNPTPHSLPTSSNPNPLSNQPPPTPQITTPPRQLIPTSSPNSPTSGKPPLTPPTPTSAPVASIAAHLSTGKCMF